MSGEHDRRTTRRRTAGEEHDAVTVRIRPGHAARLIDLSAGGALVETNCRLLPGTDVELHVETSTKRTNVRGRVLRCAVVHLHPRAVTYRGAIGFDRHLPWLAEEDGYGVPGGEKRSGLPFRAPATPNVV